MCGIIGIKLFNKNPTKSDYNSVVSALEDQRHRGPDFDKAIITGRSVLGHNRLAIIDINPRSNQPITDDTGRYTLIYNGEIYNYHDLKNELLDLGYTFKTSSDTEVLLYCLVEFGVKSLKKLNGCFAFAFYDNIDDELILARDHIGINPLLFSIQDDRILFASELRAFFKLSNCIEIDKKALSELFKFTYIPAPNTILKNVHKMLPGHYLVVKGSSLDVVKYWSPNSIDRFEGTKKEAIDTTRRLLEESVIKRMEADVPLGTFLSGGVDSSIVSAIAAKNKEHLHTFSIGFKDSPFFDESHYSELVADKIGSNHHAIKLSEEQVLDELGEVINSFDEPFADSSAIAMYFLSQEAKKELTVCLSGDGADELLAGYRKHKAFIKSKDANIGLRVLAKLARQSKHKGRRSKLENKIRQLAKFGDLAQLNWPDKYWFLAAFISDEDGSNLLKEPIPFSPQQIIDKEESLLNFLLTDQQFILPNDMLKKVDVMSMRHSLEVRTPFLDPEFVHFSNSLGDEFKYSKGKGKIILKEAFEDLLPLEIFSRSKQGFEVPLQRWLEQSWSRITNKNWFSKEYLENQGLFSHEYVIKLKLKFNSPKPEESATLMWTYIVFQHWYSRWMEKK